MTLGHLHKASDNRGLRKIRFPSIFPVLCVSAISQQIVVLHPLYSLHSRGHTLSTGCLRPLGSCLPRPRLRHTHSCPDAERSFAIRRRGRHFRLTLCARPSRNRHPQQRKARRTRRAQTRRLPDHHRRRHLSKRDPILIPKPTPRPTRLAQNNLQNNLPAPNRPPPSPSTRATKRHQSHPTGPELRPTRLPNTTIQPLRRQIPVRRRALPGIKQPALPPRPKRGNRSRSTRLGDLALGQRSALRTRLSKLNISLRDARGLGRQHSASSAVSSSQSYILFLFLRIILKPPSRRKRKRNYSPPPSPLLRLSRRRRAENEHESLRSRQFGL